MNYYEQIFNPQYVNKQTYDRIQSQIRQYNIEQNKEVYNAVKAIKDYLEAMNKLDFQHQEIANNLCIIEIAKYLNW